MRIIRIMAVFVIGCLVAISQGQAQQPDGEPGPAQQEVVENEGIPTARIIDRSLETAVLLRRAEADASAADLIRTIRESFESREGRVQELLEDTRRRLETDGPASSVSETEKEWLRVQSRFEGWLRDLESRAETANSLLKTVRSEKAVWTATGEAALTQEMTPELTLVVEQTLLSITDVEQLVKSSRDALFDLQAIIGQAKAQADAILAEQRQALRERSRSLSAVDSPDLWSALGAPGALDGMAGQAVEASTSNLDSLRSYLSEQKVRLLKYLFALLSLAGGILLLRRRARIWVEQDPDLTQAAALLNRPLAAGITITALVLALTDSSAPNAWDAALGLILLFAVVRLLPVVLAGADRRWAYVLAVLFVLQHASRLLPHGTTLHRLVLLLLALAGLAATIWLLRDAGRPHPDMTQGWLSAIRLAMGVAAALFFAGAIANIVGRVGFAGTLITGTMRSLLAAVALLIAVLLAKALIRVIMLLKTVRKLGIVSQRGETTRRTLFRTIMISAVLAWLMVSLDGFLALSPALEWLMTLGRKPIPLGQMTLTPADLLLFILSIWVSFKLARLVSFVLETDILPTMNLPRGVPGAVTRLSRYAIIIIGLFAAVSVAGFSLDKVTLVFGALGVGVGFGLQNIVNNFVCGLILLFERPVQVGDVIALSSFEGVVRDIGIRASKVRTYSGADIVVPNANLISAEVVNWTLQDHRRRVEIPVSVAYGTDPETVIGLLTNLASDHPAISASPEPQGLFLGFGESGLDFQIRAWTSTERFLGVSSDLRVALTAALAAAGIEIPYPQRDLHLRSIDAGVEKIIRN